MFVFLWDVTGHTSYRKFHTYLVNLKSIFLEVLSLCSSQQWFWPISSPVAPMAESLSYCWFMKPNLNGGGWGLLYIRCCSGLFHSLHSKSLIDSWSSTNSRLNPRKDLIDYWILLILNSTNCFFFLKQTFPWLRFWNHFLPRLTCFHQRTLLNVVLIFLLFPFQLWSVMQPLL